MHKPAIADGMIMKKEHIRMIGPSLRNALVGALLALSITTRAQLVVNQQADLQQLVQTIAGPGVQVANPVLDCHAQGHGTFSYAGGLLNTSNGVLLTTGTIANAIGPNLLENASFEQFTTGSTLLTTMTGRTTHDACHLEFDLIPSGDTVLFNYTFASEEYAEWVGSQYSDVFGVFISGPGITGDPGLGGERNLALVPVTNEPVMINTVNAGSNTAYFQNNTGNSQIQYDGLTRQLSAKSAVLPCAAYRIKMVVADVSDRIFDSGLFIAPISSNGVTMSAFTSNGLPYAVEGCNAGTVRFTRITPSPLPLPVTFYLGGTATNGTDYPMVGLAPGPAIAHTVIIPGGQASADVVFDAINDGIPEGSEIIRVYLGSAACPGVRTDSLDLTLNDDLQMTVSPSQSICSGVTANLLASGATSYSWSPGTGLNNATIQGPIATPTTTTTYTVTGTTGSCTRSLSTTVTVSNMVLSGAVTRPLCTGQANGIINLSITGGVVPYTFAWTGPDGYISASEDLVNIAAGTYTVIVTDGVGCTRTQSFNVSAPDALSASLLPSILPFGQNISCFSGSDGSLDLTVNGGTAPYAVLWSGPNGFVSNLQDISDLLAGTYSATVTDQNGCSIGAAYTLIQTPALVPAIGSLAHVTCFGASNGTATATVSGGIPPYSFSWNTIPAQNTATATGLPPGPRTVTITDGYGCTTTTSITITQPSAPLSVSLTGLGNVIHCQGNSQQHGTATAVPVGGTPPYTFHWNTVPVQNTAAAIFISGGNYTVTVTDSRGCMATNSFTVDQPGSPTATSVQTNVSCFGSNTGTAAISISGGSNIQSAIWNTTPPQSGSSATNLPPGTWTLTTQHADGCQSQFSVTILGPATALTPTFGAGNVNHVSCAGGSDGSASVTISGGGVPYTYAWNTIPVQTSSTATGLSAGSYSVTVTDAFGCTAQASSTISQPAPLAVNISGFTNVLCFGGAQGTADALATGGTAPYSYSWNSTPVQTGANATDLPAGTYIVTATDAKGCNATASVTIGGPQFTISASFESFGNETCHSAADGFATVIATGGSNSFTYTWNTVPPTIGPTISGLAPGTYEVEVVDNNGCDSPKYHSITILGAAGPLEIQTNISEASCTEATNGSIDLTVTGGVGPYSYLWTDDNGISNGNEDPSSLSPGTYDLTVSDSYGCYLDTSIIVGATNDLGITSTVDQVPCMGASNAALTATVIDGTAPYAITWSGPNGFTSTSTSLSDLEEGTYVADVLDGNGCQASTSVDLIGTAPPTIGLLPSNYFGGSNISCAGANDGAVDLTISGGTAPFTVTWSDGLGFNSSDEDINGLSAGVYQVSVLDANGCLVNDLAVLTAPSPMNVSATLGSFNGSNVSCSSSNDGSVDITVTGGTPSFSYAWDNTSTSEDLYDLSSGTYTVLVTDTNGCTVAGSWTLNAPAPLDLVITPTLYPGGTGTSCVGVGDGELSAGIVGGIAPYSIAWYGPGGFTSDQASINGLQAGLYTMQVTDANGCMVEQQATIDPPNPLTITLNSPTFSGGYHIACAGGSSGSVAAVVTGGSPTYTYFWTGPAGYTSTNATLSDLSAGVHAVIVTDQYGCSAEDSIALTEPPLLDIQHFTSDAGSGYQIGCDGNDGAIATLITGGTPQYQVDWTGPNGFASMDLDLNDLLEGNYHLAMTDANGCVMETDVLLAAPAPINASLEPMATACPGDDTGSIAASLSGGVAPYGVTWSGPNGFSSTTEDLIGIMSGSYTMVVTDLMGCTASFNTQLDGPAPISSGAYVANYGQYNLQCIGDSTGVIELSPQGGTPPYLITVNGPSGPVPAGSQMQNLIAGSYSVNIVDANGCTLDTLITLLEPVITIGIDLVTSVYPSGDNVSCHNGSDGWIEASVVGGTGPFSFNWRGPDSLEFNTPNIYNIPAGDYSYELVVIDDNGCSVTTSVTLSQPDTSLYGTTDPSSYNGGYNLSCSDSNDGAIDLEVAGGSGGYSFEWFLPNGSTSSNEDLSGAGPGMYNVIISDMNGCTLQDTVVLFAPDTLQAQILVDQYPSGTAISCSGLSDGSITAITEGGVPTYSMSWTGPNGFSSNAADLQDLPPGDYCLTLVDANGCTAQTCTTVDEPEVLNAIPTTTDAPCGAATGAVDLTVSGGTSPYVFTWNTGATTAALNDIAPGSYSVTITDANNCITTVDATVSGSSVMELQADITEPICYGEAAGMIDLSVTGGMQPLSYAWNNGSNGEDLVSITIGTYSVIVTDAMGCTTNAEWQVNGPDAISITAITSSFWNGYNISHWSGSDGSIGLNVGGGSAPYTYTWSNNATSQAIVGLTAGSYTVVVTDVNGCTSTLTITLEEPNDLIMPTAYSPNGDGANDLFVVQGLEAYPANTLVIFNRWGNVVYDRLNYRNDWGGENSQGQPLPNGTYFAILQVENGARTLQGYIDLRR